MARPNWWRRARQHFSIEALRMAVRSRWPLPWRAVAWADQPGREAALMLKFKYYQQVEGTIAVPAGEAIHTEPGTASVVELKRIASD